MRHGLLTLCIVLNGAVSHAAVSGAPPSARLLLKPQVWTAVSQERQVAAHAKLEEIPGQPSGSLRRKYTFYATMWVGEEPRRVREAMLDFPMYAKKISYIQKSDYDPKTGVLDIAGGVWNYGMHSWIRFESRSPEWVHYKVLRGSFEGMEGDITFEATPPRGTIAYFNGLFDGEFSVPQIVMERGAEMALSYTGATMRSLIESSLAVQGAAQAKEEAKHDPSIPQPRRGKGPSP